MSKLEKQTRRKKIIYLLIGLVIIGILVWAAWLILNPAQRFENDRIRLDISGPTTLLSGQDVSYLIKYGNQERVNLNRVVLTAYLPNGFNLKETNPLSSSATQADQATNRINTWNLGTLKVGQTGEIEIKGKLVQDTGTATVTANLSYEPANFSSEFQQTASFNTEVTSSILTLDFSGPAQISPRDKVTYEIKYKNNLPDRTVNAKITIFYPSDFSPGTISPEPSSEKLTNDQSGNIWYKDNLNPNQEQTIDLTGNFSPESSGQKNLKARIELKEGDNLYLNEEKTLTTEIVKEGLILNLIINGQTTDQPITAGDYLNYSIIYRNNGQATISDIKIQATLDSQILDWSTLEDKNKGTINGNEIIWSKNTVPGLALLPPGNEGSLDFKIKTKTLDQLSGLGPAAMAIKSSAELIIGQMNGQTSTVSVPSNQIATKTNTDLNLKVEGRYFNDDNIAIGSGPIPPKVGEQTNYQIFWTLTNTLHEATNVKISTSLPTSVSWTGKTNLKAGQLDFNPATRQIAWTINRIPLGTSALTANFELSITPTSDQAGRILILIPETNLQATDSETQGQINQTRDGVTTNLDTDPTVKGKGVVTR